MRLAQLRSRLGKIISGWTFSKTTMIIGAVKESSSGEKRVAATPQSVKKMINLGYEVRVESGCGENANFSNSMYEEAGAQVVDNDSIWSDSDVVLKVTPPNESEIGGFKHGANLISFLWPSRNAPILQRLNEKNISALAMDCVPRISRAQKLDALSSMANIAGYRAVIEAANEYGSFFTGQITAAGKVPPAKVLVIGAGVAGLSAIGTARSLGAIVRAFDTRLAVKEQIKSMGADFLELEFEESGEGEGGYAKTMSDEFIAAEMALFAEQAKEVNIIVTTALIPGKPAPELITSEMVHSMKPGSVIVDLAAEQGGNCALTEPDKKVRVNGVTIIGYTDLPSRLPTQSSTLYSNNIVNLLTDMTPEKDGQLVINLDDPVVLGSLATYQGQTKWPPPKIEDPSPKPSVSPAAIKELSKSGDASSSWGSHWATTIVVAIVAALLIWFVGKYAPAEFVSHFTVFVLACFVGWQLVWNVTPALHTPLMSVTNAISGIIVIGGMLQMTSTWYSFTSLLAAVAVLIAAINVAGGFLVTHRMLAMFHKQD
jgi:NAD(P) transhydrogenase subunit alpha